MPVETVLGGSEMEQHSCYMVLDEKLKRTLKTVGSWLYGPHFLAPEERGFHSILGKSQKQKPLP